MWSKKAYLLEFYDNKDTKAGLKDAFGFSLPPQSEDFTFTQRVVETKTFGGSVFDDYGNDSVKINISGTTANEEVKRIYRGKKGSAFLSGEDEIFQLQKIVEDWGKNDKIGNKYIYLYCLDSQKKGIKYWQVVIDSLQIRRSKDSPLAYNYTLNCTGFPPKSKETTDKSFIDKLKSGVNQAYSFFCLVLDGIEWVGDYIKDALIKVRSSVDKINALVVAYADLPKGFVELGITAYKETVLLGAKTISEANRFVENKESDILSYIDDFKKKNKELITLLRSVKTEDLPEEYQGLDEQDIECAISQTATELELKASEIETNIRKMLTTISITIIPGDKEDTIFLTYGSVEKKVKDSDTWDSLAYEYYNDASLGVLIAAFNMKELKTGENVYIPMISPQQSIGANNEIYPINGERDNYGKDILIDSYGDFGCEQGDLAVTDGFKNLEQAISLRLNSEVDSRIRLETYGIRANIGDVSMAQNFILSSIKHTLEKEPRISSVKDVKFKGKEETLYVEVVYEDINHKEAMYGGTF